MGGRDQGDDAGRVVADLTGSTWLDWLFRQLYRTAFPFLLAYRRRFAPQGRGVTVAIWVGDEVLVARHSYRPHLELPGGHTDGDEPFAEAAKREIREELGIDLHSERLRLVGERSVRLPGRVIEEAFFEVRFDAFPRVRIDRRELTQAVAVNPATLPRSACGLFLRQYLRRYASIEWPPESPDSGGKLSG